MRYVEYPPSLSCAPIVERFWLLEGQATGHADAILPDGRIELVFHYDGTFWRHREGTAPTRQPSALLVGQMIEPVLLTPEGCAGVAAIRLRPAAARTLLGFSLREISAQFHDLESVFPSAARLRQRLAESRSDVERIQAMERWVLSLVRFPPRPQVAGVVETILHSGGRFPIDAVAAYAGLSVRQLERHFLDDVGLTPKAFSRIVRLQAALRRIREGRALSDVAIACGYYDQAHMTRDFRHLAAMSPGGWQSHAGELAPLFVEHALEPCDTRSHDASAS
jgi:AraC-like DNA-binding protein